MIHRRDGYLSLSITLLAISFCLVGSSTVFKIFDSQELGPANPSCTELGTCDLFSHPLDAMMQPWIDDFGPFTYPMIWGIILGIIWLRTHNTLLVGSVGIVIAGFLTIASLNSINPNIWLVGASLLGLSIGVVLYQLLFSRTLYPTS